MKLESARDFIGLEARVGAHNYRPLEVVLCHGEGAWVQDVEGKRYLDGLAGYSALNFGHRHPTLVEATKTQLDQLSLTSRAFFHDQLGPFCQELATLCGMDAVLPMNTGVEAVETALKLARRWGYTKKGIGPDRAKIVVAGGNFHGRTISVISFSDDEGSRSGFGPFTPGFVRVPYQDDAALESVMDDEVAAVLVEPIQGEGGVVIPKPGYLKRVQEICRAKQALMVLDEIQSGMGRSGTTFAFEHDGLAPDVLIMGKALGGGILPVSAVAASRQVMDVFTPGSHGSTFGGNPLACAVGRAVVKLLQPGTLQAASRERGAQLKAGLDNMSKLGITAVRQRGLWVGVDLDPALGTGRQLCEAVLQEGLLLKDTHGSTVRMSPPLVASEKDVAFMLEAFEKGLVALGNR